MSEALTQSALSRTQSNPQGKLLPLALGFGTLLLFVVFAFFSSTDTSNWVKFSTIGLFSLPVIAQLIGSLILWDRITSKEGNIAYYRVNLGAASASIVSYCVLWLVYSNKWFVNNPNLLQFLSMFALVLVAVLLFFVGLMTAAFIMARSKTAPTKFLAKHCETLRKGIKAEPLWAIALFFILFLGVTYLFGFALAFHDQYALWLDKDRPALRMLNLKSIDDSSKSYPGSDGSAQLGSTQDSGSKVSSALPSMSPSSEGNAVTSAGTLEEAFCFYFRAGEAHLRTKPYNKCNTTTAQDRTDANLNNREEFNDCSLRALVERLKKESAEDMRIRVSLTGHASDEPIERRTASQRFVSNYELSEARAHEVRFQTLNFLGDEEKWHNVEWSILPVSSEPKTQAARGLGKELFKNRPKELQNKFPGRDIETLSSSDIEKAVSAEEIFKLLPPEEKRVVVAAIKAVPNHVTTKQMKQILENEQESKFRSPKLIDYMYFSVYTITTTGYGDIVPTTAYAQFVTSLANICEVLFLVVFFNALISIKGDNNNEPGSTPSSAKSKAKKDQPQEPGTLLSIQDRQR